ncbi:GntR family transcriptional regulator [Ensifer sp. YR511]|uniref:GntR family transcriptional regulator n=1 Tax=Ensifer sp. YR511 TaxID=1855294 RepID=UPI000880F0AB|nr:GntR family transcriptional regulator [Ensifer sp. YR511]SDN75955.1 transcriptional regulator, GntR family [Ensifer sp. YR511]
MPENAAASEAFKLNEIVNELEEDIVFGKLHPNERLIEDELLARFQTKRHIIRQVLVELERIGIVERVPNKGSRVKSYSEETVLHLYQLRDILESNAAKLIPLPVADGDLEMLRQIQAEHDSAVKRKDIQSAFRINIRFHRALFELTGNPFLTKVIEEYANHTHGFRFYAFRRPEMLARSRDEHHEIINALERSDRAMLVKLCRNHLIPARDLFIQESFRTNA